MVNCIIVSEYGEERDEPWGRKKIPGGPLYDLGRIQHLCVDTKKLILWTRKCASDVQGLALEVTGVAALIAELGPDCYIDSEWCQSRKAWAACDAYRLARWEEVEHAGKRMKMEYFLKFAIGRTGQVLLVASCHLSH